MSAEETTLPEFNLSLVERETAIRTILEGSDEEILTAGDIKQRWSSYLQKTIGNVPWVAVAKSPTDPNGGGIVDVVNIDFFEFEAEVEPIVEENEKTEALTAHLMNIFPLSIDPENQDKGETAAQALDHFRYCSNTDCIVDSF